MATKLKNIRLTSVDLVRAGANQEADIRLFKSVDLPEPQPEEREKNILKRFLNWIRETPEVADPEPEAAAPVEKAEEQPDLANIYKSAITESIQSIIADDSLTAAEKSAMVEKSLAQYHEKMIELGNSHIEKKTPVAAPEPEPAPVEKSREPEYVIIEEVQKSDYITIEEVEKANPWHDSSTGRFSSGPGGAAGGVAHRTMANGGISYHVKSGKEPKSGYMCAVYADRAEWIKGDDVSNPEKRTAAIKNFMEKNKDVLSDPDNYLGTWYDTESGNISLDISRNFSDKKAAIKYASEHNEKAIWDVKNMTEIPTGGTGNNID